MLTVERRGGIFNSAAIVRNSSSSSPSSSSAEIKVPIHHASLSPSPFPFPFPYFPFLRHSFHFSSLPSSV